MVTEFKDTDHLSANELALREHSGPSKAKKVINVGPHFPLDSAASANFASDTKALTAAPETFSLKPKTAYRLVASSAFHFRLSTGTSAVAAAVTDIYLAAGEAMIIKADAYQFLSAVKATGAADGIVQLTVVQ